MKDLEEINQMCEEYFNELPKLNQHIKLINQYDITYGLFDMLGEVKEKEIIL